MYQDHVAKSLTEKYASLNGELDKVIYAANSEVSELRAKLESTSLSSESLLEEHQPTSNVGMTVDQDTLRRKNDELRTAYEDKARKQLQTQEMYDKLKRQSLLGQVQNAATDAVEHHIEASIRGDRFDDRLENQDLRIPQPIFGGGQQSTEHGTRRHNDALEISTGTRPNLNDSWNTSQGVLRK